MRKNNYKKIIIPTFLLFYVILYIQIPVFNQQYISLFQGISNYQLESSTLFQMTILGKSTLNIANQLQSILDSLDLSFLHGSTTYVYVLAYMFLGTAIIPILAILGIITSVTTKKFVHVIMYFEYLIILIYTLLFALFYHVASFSIGFYALVAFLVLLFIIMGVGYKSKYIAASYACLIPGIGFFIASFVSQKFSTLWWYLLLILSAGIYRIGIVKYASTPQVLLIEYSIIGILLFVFLIGHLIAFIDFLRINRLTEYNLDDMIDEPEEMMETINEDEDEVESYVEEVKEVQEQDITYEETENETPSSEEQEMVNLTFEDILAKSTIKKENNDKKEKKFTIADEILKLHKLKEEGIISEEEFIRFKQKMLK